MTNSIFSTTRRILLFAAILFVFPVGSLAVDCYTSTAGCTNMDTQIKGSRPPFFATDTGVANAYVLTTTAPLGPTLRTGSRFYFFAANANTTASTVNTDTTGVLNLKKFSGGSLVALSGGEIAANQWAEIAYDGTQYQLLGSASSFSALSGTLACSQMPTFTGDVTNSLCAMTVVKLQGRAVLNASPSNNDVLTWVTANNDWEPMAGGGGGGTQVVNMRFDTCIPGQTVNAGDSGFTTNSYTNADLGVWDFLLNSAADVWCYVRVPHNLSGTSGSVIADFAANDSTAGHTDVFNIADVITSSLNLNVGTLTNSSTCTFTTTATAYANTECTFSVHATLAADQILVVKIHQAASSSVSADVLMPIPQLQVTETF